MRTACLLSLFCVCTTALADTVADIATQEARIAALQKDIEPLVAPLQNIHSDVRVFASLEPIVAAVAGLNNLAPAQRTVTLQSTERTGHFYDNNGLCNSYAELQGRNDLHAQGLLSNFSAAVQENGSIVFNTHASTSGHIQVHVQIFGPRLYPVGIHIGGGTCPYGGGVGTSVGANFNKDLDLHIRFAFAMAPDGGTILYQAALYDPQKVNVTISIGLGALGSYGYPTSFDIPQTPYTGQFPLLIKNGGKFTVPGEKGPREYSIQLKPASFAATKAGVAAEWTSAIDFKTPAAASTR
jgi:hypothetical protein